MTSEEKRKIYAALAAPFPEEAIERTDGRQTGRGYSTSGIKAQWIVDRLNQVLGLGSWRVHREVKVREITTSSGRRAYEAVCDLILEFGSWENGKFEVWAEALSYGGHVAMLEGDASKGAFSNSLKRAAAFLNCGSAAYRGELDEDVPADADMEVQLPPAPPPARVSQPAQPPAVTVATMATHPKPPSNGRNRLSSKQLAAIWAIGRKLNYDQQALRQFVKQRYSTQVEFLSRENASALISAMSAQANGNGHDQGQHQSEPGAEG